MSACYRETESADFDLHMTVNGGFSQLILILICLFAAVSVNASELKPFTTDGCSAFPDGDNKQNAKWISCCIRHDFAYWKGGTYEQRELADYQLQQCVEDIGEKNISLLMHVGVRLGGSPFFPTWYRWGYGWPYLRGYEPLNAEEKLQIKDQLMVLRGLIDEFIQTSE